MECHKRASRVRAVRRALKSALKACWSSFTTKLQSASTTDATESDRGRRSAAPSPELSLGQEHRKSILPFGDLHYVCILPSLADLGAVAFMERRVECKPHGQGYEKCSRVCEKEHSAYGRTGGLKTLAWKYNTLDGLTMYIPFTYQIRFSDFRDLCMKQPLSPSNLTYLARLP
jgi:hypothetical protein